MLMRSIEFSNKSGQSELLLKSYSSKNKSFKPKSAAIFLQGAG